MSVDFPGSSGNGIWFTQNVLDYNQPYDYGGWVYWDNPANFNCPFAVGNNNVGQRDIDYVESLSSKLNIAACVSASFNEVAGLTTLAANTWYFVWMQRTAAANLQAWLGTLHKLPAIEVTNTFNTAGRLGTRNYMSVGVDGPDDDRHSGLVAYACAYTRNLTLDEIIKQSQSVMPVSANGIYGCWPLMGNPLLWNVDFSGNRNHFTNSSGTLTGSFDPVGVAWNPPTDVTPQLLNQISFRFRNDNGSESTATWRQNQDVNDTNSASTRFRVRVQIDTTGDEPAKNFMIQVKKSTDPDAAYRNISVKQ